MGMVTPVRKSWCSRCRTLAATMAALPGGGVGEALPVILTLPRGGRMATLTYSHG